MNNLTDINYDFSTKMWIEFLEKAFETKQSRVIYAIILCVIFVFSLMSNMLTCFIIYYVKSMHTVTNIYIFNLATSDLLFTFAMVPDIIDSLNPTFECSQMICITFWFTSIFLCNNGILTLTALSFERYFAVWHPMKLKSDSDWRRVFKIIILLWLIAITEALPDIMTVSVVRIHQNNVCFPIPTPLAKIFHVIQGISTFIVPLVIMISVYSTILFKVNIDAVELSENKINNRDSRGKVNKLIVSMTIAFLMCWLPFFIMRVLLCTLNERQLFYFAEWWSPGYQIVSLSAWLSVVLNPILFCHSSTKFRKVLKSLWNGKIKRTSVTT